MKNIFLYVPTSVKKGDIKSFQVFGSFVITYWYTSYKDIDFSFRCEVDIWHKPSPIPREELLKRIKDKQGIYCMLTERLDLEFFEAAGNNYILYNMKYRIFLYSAVW